MSDLETVFVIFEICGWEGESPLYDDDDETSLKGFRTEAEAEAHVATLPPLKLDWYYAVRGVRVGGSR